MNKPLIWRVVAVIYTMVNFGGAIYAGGTGEWMHAVGHIGLLLAGYFAWQFVPNSRGGEQKAAIPQQTDQQLEYLQQSVDAIAVEVERIGEAQRFSEKIQAEQGQKPPAKPQ